MLGLILTIIFVIGVLVVAMIELEDGDIEGFDYCDPCATVERERCPWDDWRPARDFV